MLPTLINDSIKTEYAPDKRVALYQVSVKPTKQTTLTHRGDQFT
ncbi:MAG: hypothetical protein U5K51_03070 [Flavobacteriaceae bacterium]|nr:hypothetical protein [Flavobacteriaceae bacterium]